MKIEMVDIGSLTPDPMNARDHTKGIPELAASLREFGQQKNLVVWQDTVIAGNGLMLAAQSLGWTQIAVSRVPDEWTLQQARAYALTDNKTAELSTWDVPMVETLRMDIDAAGIDLEMFGFEPLTFVHEMDLDSSAQLNDMRFAIIIECESESQQAQLLERFERQKLTARPLML
jgi:hypothetical protein